MRRRRDEGPEIVRRIAAINYPARGPEWPLRVCSIRLRSNGNSGPNRRLKACHAPLVTTVTAIRSTHSYLLLIEDEAIGSHQEEQEQ
ncbi:hypothetical protein ATE48_10585 [Candidatus Viadribacter manganicus]|uniref:Uncharacterized protein n=1 Tax=Candidatus Viadribacter manganicus TaxID=1759059 RepID=A0A1B1AID4_9PROT|nr:hypothetical protein ATE48_10585 [Candidatus Viadribacter manganicus]